MSKYLELNDGRRMPTVGLGTYQGNLDWSVSKTVAVYIVLLACLDDWVIVSVTVGSSGQSGHGPFTVLGGLLP